MRCRRKRANTLKCPRVAKDHTPENHKKTTPRLQETVKKKLYPANPGSLNYMPFAPGLLCPLGMNAAARSDAIHSLYKVLG